MAKPSTIKIRLNSTADTGHFYVTKKNSRTMTDKMVVKKYDPVARKHVEYKEGKINAEDKPYIDLTSSLVRLLSNITFFCKSRSIIWSFILLFSPLSFPTIIKK